MRSAAVKRSPVRYWRPSPSRSSTLQKSPSTFFRERSADSLLMFIARRITARFYGDSILPEAPALAEVVMRSGPGCLDIADGQF